MFIRAQLFYFALISLLLSGFLYYSLNYYALHIASEPKRVKPTRPIFHQKRSFVTKDFYLCDSDHRYHHRLTTPSSTLHYDPNQTENPLIETMENVSGLFQDKISDDKGMQQIHSIWAPQGTYHYMSRFFSGSSVLVSLFSVPGNQLPTRLDAFDPFLEGKAKNVSFFFENSSSVLKSDHFKARVNTDKREVL